MKINLFMAAALSFFGMTAVHAENITIHGSTTVEANLFKPHLETLQEATGDTYNVIGNGSSRGIKGIDEGLAQVGMISSGFDGTMKKLEMEDRAGEFTHEKVGESIATFAVHPSNPVTDLTKDQIVGILKGEITNWSDVGGNDAPIVVVTEYEGGGLRDTIEKKVLGKQSIHAGARAMPNAPQIAQVTAQLPTAFATVTTAMLKGGTLKKINSDADVVQPLILVIKGEPTPAFERLVTAAKEALQ